MTLFKLGSNIDLEAATGNNAGMTAINKFGRNASVDAGVEEEIWDGSAAYVWPTSAVITSISQTADQVAMRGAQIDVQGLDANWDLVVQKANLDASNTTTVVTLTTPLLRVFRMKVEANVVGDSDIRAHNAAETQDYAVITAGYNQTQMAIYTIPAGKTAYCTNYYAHVNPATNLDPTSNPICLLARDNANGYERQLKHIIGQTTLGFQHFFCPYVRFTEKTDIFITANPVGKAADVSAGFDLIIVDQ